MLLAVITTVAASRPHEHLWARALGGVPDDTEPAIQEPGRHGRATSQLQNGENTSLPPSQSYGENANTGQGRSWVGVGGEISSKEQMKCMRWEFSRFCSMQLPGLTFLRPWETIPSILLDFTRS